MKISLLKDVRILILIFLLVIFAYALLSPYVFRRSGVLVSFAEGGCLKDGDIITRFEGLNVVGIADYLSLESKVKQNQTVTLTVNGLPRPCVAAKDGSLEFLVKEIPSGNLKFGIDIEGGSRVLLKPKIETTPEKISETIGTLNQRINFYGLRDIRVSPVGQNLIQIEVAGASAEEIKDFLARQGKFEGKILYEVRLRDGAGKFFFDDTTYDVKKNGDRIFLDDKIYAVNDTINLRGYDFRLLNITNNSVAIHSELLTGKDVVAVLTDPQFSRVAALPNGGYQFFFTVRVTSGSAERFAALTKNQPVKIVGNERYIEPKLDLLLDGQLVSSLDISANLAGRVETSATIQGGSSTRDGAFKEKLQLETLLRSGSLPVELDIVKVETITQTAGREFINSTLLVVFGAAATVSAVIFVRYRKIKIALPLVMISFSEIILVLGVYALTNIIMGGNGWTLDIPAVAGLIAIIGTGVNQLIIITDQMLLEQEQTVSYRRKVAMSMILNSAYMVITAMIPLIVLGVGTLRGFAITTIIGVLIAVSITRPAYTAILKRIAHLEG